MNDFELNENIVENASILIVDDEIETLEIFSRQLSDNFDVDTVQSAYLALEMMKKKSYHIALTDLVMPGEDGLELLESIKKEWPNTAVVVISGKASIDMAVKAMKLGAEEFIEKPIEDLQILEYKTKKHTFKQSFWYAAAINSNKFHFITIAVSINQISK